MLAGHTHTLFVIVHEESGQAQAFAVNVALAMQVAQVLLAEQVAQFVMLHVKQVLAVEENVELAGQVQAPATIVKVVSGQAHAPFVSTNVRAQLVHTLAVVEQAKQLATVQFRQVLWACMYVVLAGHIHTLSVIVHVVSGQAQALAVRVALEIQVAQVLLAEQVAQFVILHV